MPKLTDDIKALIVTQLAQFRGYAEVARLVTEETGVAVDRFQVRSYDPTNLAYASGEKWRAIFETARHACLNSVDAVPISHKAYRLNQLQRILDEALSRGDVVIAMATLRQAAKEVGNSLTNERNIRLDNPRSQLHDLSPEERRSMAADILRSALANHKQKSAAN